LPSAAATLAKRSASHSDWTIEDMWTGYPCPAHDIGYGQAPQHRYLPPTARLAGSIGILFD
jgi:hypothetical protein